VKKRLLFLLATTLIPLTLQAQKIELGAGLGVLHYKGEFSPAFHPAFARPGGSLFFRYNKSQALSFRANLMGGTIFADERSVKDPFNQARGAVFRTRILEASADVEYNFLNYNHQNLRTAGNWSPYVFGGIGLMSFKPNVPPTADYRTNGLVLPFGVGVKWQLRSPWSLALEVGTRKTFTDYLDNFGDSLDPVTPFAQADPGHKDFYYYTSVSLSYTFYRIVCP